MRHPRLVPAFLILTQLVLGCRSARPSGDDQPAPAAPKTTLEVDNRGFLEMTVYAFDASGQRVRLGVAGSHAVTLLTIPEYLVRSVTVLRFLADPVGGRGPPVSDEITVEPGDVVTLIVRGS